MSTGVEQITDLLARADARAVVRRIVGDVSADRRLEIFDRVASAAEQLAISDLATAIELSEELVLVADEVAFVPAQVRSRRAYAQALAYASRLDEAIGVLDESLVLASGHQGCQVEDARSRLTRLHALARLGRLDEAVEEGERAREMLLAADEPALAARADLNLGVTHRMRGATDQALMHFDRAAGPLASEPTIAAQLESNRAEVLLDLSRFGEAEKSFERALRSFEQLGVERAAGIVEGNLADLLSRQGRLSDALPRFERARRRLMDDASRGERARLDGEQADCLVAAGLYDEAATSYGEAAATLEELGLGWDGARARTGLARALIELGRHDEAVAALDRAESVFRSLGHGPACARVSTLRGTLALRHDEPDEARRLFESVLSTVDASSFDGMYAVARLAEIDHEDGRSDDAEARLTKSIDIATGLGSATSLSDLLHTRARIRRTCGRVDEAIADLHEAVAAIERMRRRITGERLRGGWLGSRERVFADLVLTLLERGGTDDVATALATADRAKSRVLLDLLSGAVEAVDVARRRATDPGEERLLAEIVQRQGELNLLHDRCERIGRDTMDAAADLQAVRECERRLRMVESRVDATGGLEDIFAPSLDPSAIQAALPRDAALIEYFICGDELMVFVVKNDSLVVARRLATVDQVRDLLDRLGFQMSRAASRLAQGSEPGDDLVAAARRELERLHACLMAPVADSLVGIRRLFVIPHGPLHALPFAALHDGEQYLVERYDIAHAVSATVLSRASTEPVTDRRVLVGVADGVAPRIEDELTRVAAVLGDAVVVRGHDATLTRVPDVVADAAVAHFACHGRFSSASPASSGLRLSDGWLTARTVQGLRLRGATVILSACDAGGAAVERGDEAVGLARSFLAAGVRALVVSLWLVHDESTSELMEDLYGKALARGTLKTTPDVTSGLAAAQRRLLARRPHPLLWAPFIAMETL